MILIRPLRNVGKKVNYFCLIQVIARTGTLTTIDPYGPVAGGDACVDLPQPYGSNRSIFYACHQNSLSRYFAHALHDGAGDQFISTCLGS